jgi:thioredoxin-related protein
MKTILILLSALLFVLPSFAQTEAKPEPPYKRFPSVPPFKLLLTDSSTIFTKEDLSKKKATMIMLFSPDCDHCQHETEQIILHKEAFEKVQIVMATIAPFDKMLSFHNKYDLKRFDNIVMGKEINYVLPTFYNIRNFPFLAFYNKKKELISVFEGSMPIQKIVEELKK